MTDIASDPSGGSADTDLHTSEAARRRLKARYASEFRFKLCGIAAVVTAGLFLVLLLSTIVGQALPAFVSHQVTIPVDLSQETLDPNNEGESVLRRANYDAVVRNGIRSLYPFAESRDDQRTVSSLISSGSAVRVREAVLDDPEAMMGQTSFTVPLDDVADLYFKDLISDEQRFVPTGIASPTGTEGTIQVLSTANDFRELLADVKEFLSEEADGVARELAAKERSLERAILDLDSYRTRLPNAPEGRTDFFQSQINILERGIVSLGRDIENLTAELADLRARSEAPGAEEELSRELPSILVEINGGVVKANRLSASGIEGDVIIPLQSTADAVGDEWSIREIILPERNRQLDDRSLVYLDLLADQDRVERTFNTVFFTSGASREAELAGIWGAVVGSFFTMVVTLALAFPLGVAAAIYLEEFAPKNRLTQIIEVNINNLAAVPSIVFGLLGLAVFLNVFGMPRSAPVVGGMVLALMTLPTIIIASRAALRAVPPSIREGALGVGASKLQTVLHHVLPLAMPGILTGTIIGMAQALGETAPLLMIGMVAFIVDVPSTPLDPSTVMPVQIFMWADFPEVLFRQKTSAAILVLLAFLITMNALAVILRKRFERRW
ncbi:MAG: phosphate ABC transporter permease PstA [Rhizobiales bacterium]|nr:phosphate ABC transporter permease PstA [Hyphomicrobiales bacterium]MBO6699302.1 phosphate ABC transporter permease PstA [Hyphomicrobiales bacterium]MBO6736840.1 phosphate ABC transporter permease PstA [Hyphomicrobiales bacterium]MBO6912086.1 phosphate ABC transporter permease PstA [Hyphomicrobiales bacterium]MBO6954546.1 phosphate ABC transporter permease PstA [Hyphomicrobiales bacterium]